MQFTSVGRNLQFLLGGGYMDLTTYVLTPNAQFLSDVRFWIDTYPNVYLEFLEYMRTPVTSWYEILMTLTGAPNYLGIYGYLPSEPALYQIPCKK